jgi:heme exporter protein A
VALRDQSGALAVAPLPRTERTQGPAIALSNVTRVFGAVPAVVRLDLKVERGQTILVRGPNGAGKSTLLRIIATAISPTYGGGAVLGFELSRDREEIRRRTELLGHRTRLYEDLTAEENLRFVCALFDIRAEAIGDAIERVALSDVRAERVRGFSQGMRQRLALARVALRRPELLLLDEPYAGLDEEAKDLVDGLIRETASRGATAVLATHDATRGRFADRFLVMDSGRLGEGPVA